MPTPFQKRVYEEVKKIPKGKTTTYKAIAQKLKTSPRAVGQALKKNPFSYAISSEAIRNRRSVLRRSSKETNGILLIACHRVICSNGTIGGYHGNRPSNIKKKIELLKKEGVRI